MRVRPTCVVDGCRDPHQARGYCATHYQRWRRYGDPLAATHIRDQVGTHSGDRLPAAPLLAALDRTDVDKLGNVDSKRIRRARERGWVAVEVADHLAIKVLGMHPALIYGDAWWMAEEVAA